jgi:hypothetical protein
MSPHRRGRARIALPGGDRTRAGGLRIIEQLPAIRQRQIQPEEIRLAPPNHRARRTIAKAAAFVGKFFRAGIEGGLSLAPIGLADDADRATGMFFYHSSARLPGPNNWRNVVPELVENCQLLGKA